MSGGKVFGSKYRTKRLYGDLRAELKEVFHKLALQKGCRIIESYLMSDHVHMLIKIPPKYSVAHIVGFLKGKTAIYVAIAMQESGNIEATIFGRGGYYVSIASYNEEVVRPYIRNKEKEDKASD